MKLTNDIATMRALNEARETLEQGMKQGTLLLKNLDLQLARSMQDGNSTLGLNDEDAADYARRIANIGITFTDAGNCVRASLPSTK